ncbi:type IV toxin-antitoxin system AbiEi family antitoxin domain-containing protein, partial [Legionella pneumophila]
IAMPIDSRVPKIDYPPIKMVKYSGEAYSQGIETQEADGVSFRVYNVAKTIADCFKHRNKIGIDVAIEALKDAYAQNKVTADELWHYAKICRVAKVMRSYLEAIQ